MPTTNIDRATLYAQVWETPLRRLAPTYGITDVALKKQPGPTNRYKSPCPYRADLTPA